MTDPTVEAYKKFRPVDDTVFNSRERSNVDQASENWDSVAVALSNAIPNSAAGLLIHHRMIERYLESADQEPDGHNAIPSNLHNLIDRHTRSLTTGARQLQGADQPNPAP